MIYSKHTKLADIVLQDPNFISVLNRFGLLPGYGDTTIMEAAEKIRISSAWLVTFINTYFNPDYAFQQKWTAGENELLNSYLQKAGKSYVDNYIPNLERHILTLSKLCKDTGNIEMMIAYCRNMHNEFAKTFEDDVKAYTTCEEINHRWIMLEDMVNDLGRLFVVNLKGVYDNNLCVAVINAIYLLHNDLRQTNILRQRLLN